MSKNNKFFIEDEKGQTKEAEIITVLSIESRKYLLYSLKQENGTAIICASRVAKDENNKDKLIDIEEGEDKEKIKNFIESLSK
jgi:hypothetical protein